MATPLYSLSNNLHEKTEKHPVVWDKQHQDTLGTLLHFITNPPLLAYPDFDQRFILMPLVRIWVVFFTTSKMDR